MNNSRKLLCRVIFIGAFFIHPQVRAGTEFPKIPDPSRITEVEVIAVPATLSTRENLNLETIRQVGCIYHSRDKISVMKLVTSLKASNISTAPVEKELILRNVVRLAGPDGDFILLTSDSGPNPTIQGSVKTAGMNVPITLDKTFLSNLPEWMRSNAVTLQSGSINCK